MSGAVATGPVVAAFDFDGTITHRESLFPFLRFAAGNALFYERLCTLLPTLAGYALGLLDNEQAKERVLARFFAGTPIAQLSASAAAFSRQVLPRLVRPAALQRIAWHRDRGDRCVLVSASLRLYLAPWAQAVGFDDVLASELELTADGHVTGRLIGGNCYGAGKVRRLEQLLGPRTGYQLYVYGDSRGDRELLARADHAFYRRMPATSEEAA